MFRVAIVGATGLVGQEMVKVLQQRKFPVASLSLYASDRSEGKKILFGHKELAVKEVSPRSFEDVDIALFSAGAEVSQHWAPVAARKGVVVIDNSFAFRMDPQVPLVVPEVNEEDLRWHKRIIANPNCSTIQMVVAVNPLHRVNPVKRIVVDTYQSVSGTGVVALEELSTQARHVLEGKSVIPHVYPHQIAFNLLPEIEPFLDSGYTREEWKMVNETRKILHSENLAVSATCVRVPVYVGHSEAIHLELSRPMETEEARIILSEAPGIRVLDDPRVSLYPHPWSVAGQDEVFVGRIRKDASHPQGLAMWVVADNLRKGAALNAVQIAEALLQRGWL
ncbi:MAG: aspartate-semialdehyde dehydrogenase [Chloroflexi bacterium]|nr:aspartate-semialdehyde dehydrogenase [Chloroflexota bacterium]